MTMNIAFECNLVQAPTALAIDYRLTNRSAGDAGVFNLIATTRPDGTLEFSAATLYIEVVDGVLLTGKRALTIPPDLQMAAYVPPYASLLARGQSLTEHVSIPIPVKVMQPYRRALLRGQVLADMPATATSLVFEVGVFPVDDKCRLVAENPAFPTVLSAYPPHPAVARQQILSKSFPLQQPASVLDYRAVPWP